MKIRRIRNWIFLADLLLVFAALGLAIGLRYAHAKDGVSFTDRFEAYAFMMPVALAAWAFLYFEMSLDGFKGGWHFPAVFSKLIVAVSLLTATTLVFAFLTKHHYSRLVLLYFASFYILGLLSLRCLLRFLVSSRSMPDHRCVILGNGPVAWELATKISSHPELPFQLTGFLFPGASEATNGFANSLGTPVSQIKTLQVLELLAREKVHKLLVAMSQLGGPEIRKLIAECRKTGIQVYLVPEWYDLSGAKAELAEIDGLPLLSLQERTPSVASLALKRAMDLMLSAGILLFVSPILLFAALIVFREKGKAFRTELRCGKDGVPFLMYRLDVDRRSPKGYERFLVRWSLTELPQLWNVLRGDMSLVGPRPESAERLRYYSDWQRQRLRVPGGVTGLAQVHGLREQHSSEDKTRFDLQYIFNWSPFLDLGLILETLWTLVVRGFGQEAAYASDKFRAQAGEYITSEVADANRP
jgi:lipopolysaccharide/colanic/teichoic acid biosynthesis glycosyltransferase